MSNDPSGDDHAAVRFPPPLVALLILLAGYALERIAPLVEPPALPTLVRYGIGGFVVVASVAVLGVWPGVLFKQSGQDPKPWTATPEILVEGPYRFTRNPMYLMMVLVILGFAILLRSLWLLLLSPLCGVIIYLTAIRHEEAYLELKFGDTYRQYKERVRRWI